MNMVTSRQKLQEAEWQFRGYGAKVLAYIALAGGIFFSLYYYFVLGGKIIEGIFILIIGILLWGLGIFISKMLLPSKKKNKK
jgi:hypothetical protein